MIDYYLDNLDSIYYHGDESTIKNAFNSLVRRRDELTPLFNELIEKGIKWQEIDPETSNEWNLIILGISKLKEVITIKPL